MQTQRGRQLGNKGEIYLSIYQNAGNECLETKGNKGESKKKHINAKNEEQTRKRRGAKTGWGTDAGLM